MKKFPLPLPYGLALKWIRLGADQSSRTHLGAIYERDTFDGEIWDHVKKFEGYDGALLCYEWAGMKVGEWVGLDPDSLVKEQGYEIV